MLKLNIQRFAGEDGSVIIKVKADTKKFDRDMVDLQKRMYELTEKAEKPIEIDGVKVSGGWNLSEEEQKEYDEIYAQLDEINNKEIERIENERQITQELQNQKEAKAESNLISNEENIKVSELRAKLSELVGIYRDIEKQDVVDSKDLEYANNLKQEIIQIKKELEKITGSKISIKGITDVENNFNGIKKSVDNIGNSITGVTKKVARWGLAVFGIRSIYLGIRQAVSQIMQEDENLKYQIEYMKFAVGQAIKPVVEWIVNLVHQILAGVGAIIKILFGINIFSNATAKNFQKANTNAKKLQKTLTGFDEMNVLNEDGSTGIANSIGNALSGFGDLSDMVDNYVKKLKEALDGFWAWFWGSGNPEEQNFWSALQRTPQVVLDTLRPLYDNVIKPYLVDPFMEAFDYIKEQSRPLWEPIKNYFINMVENELKPRWESFKEFIGNKIEELRPVWEPIGNAFEEMKKNVLRAFAPFLNKLIDGFNYVFGWLGWHLDYIEIDAEDTGEAIVDEIGDAMGDVNNMQFDDKGITIQINTDTSQAERQTDNWLNSLWSGVKNVAKQAGNALSNVGSSIGSGVENIWKKVFGAKGLMLNTSSLPKLATGGIINRPGRGVPVGIGGERGAEAVVPLTDSQQMELLGSTIGKYITVELTNITELDGRQIARKVDKIQQNNNFVLNR